MCALNIFVFAFSNDFIKSAVSDSAIWSVKNEAMVVGCAVLHADTTSWLRDSARLLFHGSRSGVRIYRSDSGQSSSTTMASPSEKLLLAHPVVILNNVRGLRRLLRHKLDILEKSVKSMDSRLEEMCLQKMAPTESSPASLHEPPASNGEGVNNCKIDDYATGLSSSFCNLDRCSVCSNCAKSLGKSYLHNCVCKP